MPAEPSNIVFEIRTRVQIVQTWNDTRQFPPPRAATRQSRRHFPQPSTFPRSHYTSPRALGGSRQKPANQHIRHVVNGAEPPCEGRAVSLQKRVLPLAPGAFSLAGAQLSAGIRILFLK